MACVAIMQRERRCNAHFKGMRETTKVSRLPHCNREIL